MVAETLRAIHAAWLRAILDLPAWSVTRLSREAKVSRETIYRILEGESDTEGETLRKLSTAAGRPLPEVTATVREPRTQPRSPQEPRIDGVPPPAGPLPVRAADKAQQRIVDEVERALMQDWAPVAPEVFLGTLRRLLLARTTPPDDTASEPGPSGPPGGSEGP